MWRKSERQTIRNEDELWPLTIALCPWVYVRRADHGREMTGIPEAIAPIVIWANLAKDGTLSILSTGSVPSRPMIPRELLEPTQGRVAIGTLQEADEAYTALGYPHGSWDSVIALSEELIGRVAGRRPRELSFEWYQKEADGLCVLQQPVSACIHVERLVDLMLQEVTAASKRCPSAPAHVDVAYRGRAMVGVAVCPARHPGAPYSARCDVLYWSGAVKPGAHRIRASVDPRSIGNRGSC